MQTVESFIYKVNMEELADRCARLKLSVREDVEIAIQAPLTEDGPVLIGKFCTKRRIHLDAVVRVMRSVWRTERDFEVSDLGENKVMFLFQKKEDMEKVLLLSPWSFDKYLLILHKLMRGEAVKDIKFDRSPFWVQLHGLPTMCQTKEVGMNIGATLGEVEKVDANGKGFCLGSFLRIRVLMDVSLPLCRGRKVRLGDYGLKWVEFRYERLPVFCYLCGKVDHDEKDCLQWFRSKDTLRSEEKQFGPWLRATQDKTQRPQLVTVEKDGETRPGVGAKKNVERSSDGQVVSTTVRTNGGDTRPDEMERAAIPRADVEERTGLLNRDCFKNPVLPHVTNFEQQIRDLDAAINGNIPNMESVTIPDAYLGREECAHVLAENMLEQSRKSHVDGPSEEPQAQSAKVRPHSIAFKPMQEQIGDVSSVHPGIKFNVGLLSPKLNKAQTMKKTKSSNQRKMKENREVRGTEEKPNEKTQPQEEKYNVDGATEIEMAGTGTKRRARVPLAELENKEDNGKRIKVAGEIKELGKLFAQQLGSAAAAAQPRRAQ